MSVDEYRALGKPDNSTTVCHDSRDGDSIRSDNRLERGNEVLGNGIERKWPGVMTTAWTIDITRVNSMKIVSMLVRKW